MQFQGNNGESLAIYQLESCKRASDLLKLGHESLGLIWFTSNGNTLKIDAKEYTFDKDQLISITEFHNIEIVHLNSALFLCWNRSFYCILDHDSEVSCKGILYYGAAELPIIQPEEKQIEVLETVVQMLKIEFSSHDSLQLEMLQMMLKRLLILCTREYKRKQSDPSQNQVQSDLIREYNFLVERHFREKHSVNAYADLLHKSPKTLSNLFKKMGQKSPLQFIHDRILLEARRTLAYSEKPISEIAYALGFADLQVFSRFFRKHTGISPSEFRDTQQKGNIAHTKGKAD
ncbi:AraC family transcriptional regulator [Marinilongibacter aquaticus]|uniref:helix-turn-helix domain-containing protein n=1 Tax=Marinilongibacter aquaticus TaxID=2975157 RepID=UPI0021BD3F9C|nr:AraC family transcriptional regulator [Marinilongibacter aquaticus]UBM58557.1 AraC family transcriptional regulator [Marinilongibacter aquaticus]